MDFVWVFRKPKEHDVVQIPEPLPKNHEETDVWWGVMLLLLRIFTS